MSLRKIIIITLLGVPAGALLLFGPRRTADVPCDRTIVRYWESWAGVEGRAVQELIDEFNRTVGAQRGVFVQYVSLGSMIHERLLAACAGGDPPDVAGLFAFALPQYAELGALEPLDADLPALGIRPTEFVPALWQIGVYHGRTYGLPSTPFTIAMYYNRRLFRAAGLDPDRPPTTFDELRAFSERLTRTAPDGSLQTVGFLPSPKVLNWWHWCWPFFFGDPLDEQGRYRIDSAAGVRALEWVASYRDRFGAERTQVFEQGLGIVVEGAQNPFMAERVAIIHQGPWMANFIRRYTPDLDYAVAAFPSARPDGSRPVLVCSDLLVLPRGARHPREARLFLGWLMQQPVLERLCKAHGKISPFRTPGPDFFRDHPNPFIQIHHELAASPAAFGYPKMPTWPQIEHDVLTAVNNVWFGLGTPRDEARAAQQRIDAAVAAYERLARMRCLAPVGAADAKASTRAGS
ncbi:MAG TPA: ABC transporter substrate-binding protein [Phycisphaerae bacterium]